MGLISTIIVGALIGWVASILAKTNNQMGCLWNIAVGIVGSALGYYIASHLFHYNVTDKFSLAGLLVGVGGAVVLIFGLRALGILRRD